MLQRCKCCHRKANAMDVSGVSLEDSGNFIYWKDERKDVDLGNRNSARGLKNSLWTKVLKCLISIGFSLEMPR